MPVYIFSQFSLKRHYNLVELFFLFAREQMATKAHEICNRGLE